MFYVFCVFGVSWDEGGSCSLGPARCVRELQREIWGRAWGRFWTLLHPGSVCSVCAGPARVWDLCAIHLDLCFPKLTGSLKSQCFVGKPVLQAFCSELCFKSWWIFLLKLSYDVRFFSGSFVQKWVSNFSACVPILWCKLFYWISSDLWSHLGFLPLFAPCPDSALLSAGSSRSSCCSNPKGNSFGDTFTCSRCRMLGQSNSWHTCIKKADLLSKLVLILLLLQSACLQIKISALIKHTGVPCWLCLRFPSRRVCI